MRMWMIDPKILCWKHLLGEHGEIHKHRHNFVKGHSMEGRISPVAQIEPEAMQARHDELAEEMLRRGFNHKSPYEQPDISSYPVHVVDAKVNIAHSLRDLLERCEECKTRSTNKTQTDEAEDE
jgi:hypothetical protein